MVEVVWACDEKRGALRRKDQRRVIKMKVQGRRKRGRPKSRWLDRVGDAIKEKGLSGEELYDRATWRRMYGLASNDTNK